MKIDLTEEHSAVKQKILKVLLPAFKEEEICEMTNLPSSTVGYYRSTYKIPTLMQRKKAYRQEAEANIQDTLEHNREYAEQRAYEICADNGIAEDV